MKQRLQEGLPFTVKFLLKRLLVGAVGAGVRLAASAVNLTNRLVAFGVKHGLNFERAWRVTPRGYGGEERLPAWTARDFLFLMDGVSAAKGSGAAGGGAVRTSIIIPVFNKAEYTFQCLRSLVREVDFGETEVIVVDNASRDETARLLSHFGTLVRVVSNEENRGFVDACNQGAAVARGQYLVFLNNDTVVQHGWLENLVGTVERDERVGAVGSLCLYPSGMIQEAGSIVWRDGGAHQYGRGGSAEDRRYAFAREVDYCSGASLLVRKTIFERLGGFDRRYAPAYYEDVDLCFGVRSLGHKVVYQPASRVIHYEGVTAGTDTGAGVKHFQIVNRQKFYEKWRDTLEREHFEGGAAHVEAAANRKRAHAVIVFDERVPTPDRDAGSARMFVILKSLARWSHVVFVPLARPHAIDYERALWREGVETAGVLEYARLLRERKFYAAVFSRPGVGDALMSRVRRAAPGIKIVFDMVDAHFIRLGREYEVTRDERLREEAARYQEIETRLARESDLVWCASTEERPLMERLAPGVRVEVVPTIHAPHDRGLAFDERRDLLFVGNFLHRPNTDGVHFLMREVFPLVRESLPGVRLTLVGDNSPPEIAAYASEVVRVAGYVPDVEPFFRSARVFVAPIRFGAGVKGKIGEALAHGLPVVTSPVGAEGMGLRDGADVLIAADARGFAESIVRLYRERDLWQRLSDNGYAHVEKTFSPAVVEEIINNSLRELGGVKIART